VSAWATAYGDTLAIAMAAIKASLDVLIIILPKLLCPCHHVSRNFATQKLQ
jgi:hypothetical protein